MATEGYQKLEVWQKSMKMVTAVYVLTKQFPKEELYSLTNQIRRAAVSGAVEHCRRPVTTQHPRLYAVCHDSTRIAG